MAFRGKNSQTMPSTQLMAWCYVLNLHVTYISVVYYGKSERGMGSQTLFYAFRRPLVCFSKNLRYRRVGIATEITQVVTTR